ncbi:E3 ubiquitin-protein ligase SINA-like 5 [Aegilops tauschii subsp. strangulata]|uniref:RING-type E3 ubiquitin transferase n=1 Tax=Aegilops tauschii TaxID=37682 RepID=M8AST3_AEGTA|nr:E3 ubiquitin-protein ligase SINA-like 5 [Aegilops tauschii subsp. strangulata]
MEDVTMMGMEVFNCLACYLPLRPPIYQCSVGHFICCSCHDKLPAEERKCSTCSAAISQRCYGMERVVDSILLPCKHGCKKKIAYHHKAEHERNQCRNRPYVCPVSGCRFSGTNAQLLDHFTARHKWKTKRFVYSVAFDLQVQPGYHLLRGGDGRVFLLNMAPPESLGHAVSLVSVKPIGRGHVIRCSVGFSRFSGHYQVTWLELGSLSRSDGLLAEYFFVVPKVSNGDVVLTITIDDGKLYEEDHDDDNYKDWEDEEVTYD